jgi:hypothetical protein
MSFKKGQSGNPAGRPVGSTSYKALIQGAFVDIMNSKVKQGSTTVPYYVAFLENLKKAALIPGSKEAMYMADKLIQDGVLDDIDKHLNRSRREDTDFLSYRIIKDCHDMQQKILLTKEKYIFCMAGRRAGKTDGAVRKVEDTVLTKPDARVLIIGLSFTRCLELFWQPLMDGFNNLGIEISEHRRTEGLMKLQGGQEVHFCGNTTVDERDKIRGSKWDLVIIDEAQSQKALPILMEEIIEPTLLDRRGQLMLMGTGPKVRGTYWEELWTGTKKAFRLNWSIKDNPFIPDYENVLETIKTEKGLTDKSPLFQREYLGQISYDDDALVYRLTPANYFHDGDIANWINSQPVTDIKFSAGLDYGYIDSDGFAIVMFSTSKPERWIIFEHKGNRTGITELADKIKVGMEYVNSNPLFKQIPDRHFYIYSDSGGAGKKISYELAKEYGLPCLDAYKADKDFAIEQLQENVRTGNLKVREGGHFADECLKTVFARNEKDELTRKVDDECFHPDILDSVLYAMRFIDINYGQKK